MAIPRFNGQLVRATSLQGAQLRHQTYGAPRTAPAVAARARRRALTFPEGYMLAFWILVVTDVHRWLAEAPRGPHILLMNKAMTLAFIPVIAMILLKGPELAARLNKVVWYPLFLTFLLASTLSILAAVHPEIAWQSVRGTMAYYFLGVGSLIFLNSPRHVVTLIMIITAQYVWWGFESGVSGAVWWHPFYANYDGYGPLVLVGMPLCFFVGLSARTRWIKYGCFFLATFCILGIVTSYARAVVICAVPVTGLMWWRSPNRKQMTGAIAAGVAVLVIAANTLFPSGFFWKEISSAFTEGNTEGTGEDRWELWTAAFQVFELYPVVGAGAENVGYAARRAFESGQITGTGFYAENPRRIGGRALHNTPLQILSENGLVGFVCFLMMMVDFWRKNAKLRSPPFEQRWQAASGGEFALKPVAIGLEGGMLAYLLTSLFYNQLYMSIVWTLLVLNLLLYLSAKQPKAIRRAPIGRHEALRPV